MKEITTESALSLLKMVRHCVLNKDELYFE